MIITHVFLTHTPASHYPYGSNPPSAPFGPRAAAGAALVSTRAPSPGSPKFSRKEMQASGLPPDINVSSMKDLVKALGRQDGCSFILLEL